MASWYDAGTLKIYGDKKIEEARVFIHAEDEEEALERYISIPAQREWFNQGAAIPEIVPLSEEASKELEARIIKRTRTDSVSLSTARNTWYYEREGKGQGNS